MKYQLLTKEQLEELHQEFATFLATQQIDVNEWSKIKKETPHIAEEEIAIFSDMVWEDVLTKVTHIEHISSQYLNVFQCNSKEIIRICVQFPKGRDFLKKEDYQWFIENPLSEEIDYFTATKKYSKERNRELFELILSGGVISNSELFNFLKELLKFNFD
ncbi:MAG: hypothetical protein KGV44_00625 [Flavobacteriaceae bacterium]|nr:hypothetical protein [Flavobacteriaceae bacterium]